MTVKQLQLFMAMLAVLLVPAWGNTGGRSVMLAWDHSEGPDVMGYRIYYGTVSGGYPYYVETGYVTNVVVTGLVPGTMYYFAATAVDASGLESDYSNEVGYTVPMGEEGGPLGEPATVGVAR